MSQIDMMLSRSAPSGSHAASALDGSSSKFRFGSNPAELSAAKKVCYRRNHVVAGRSGEGLLTEPTAAARPLPAEPLKSACSIFYRPTETW
jgi:hypothetical protein